MVEVTGWVRGLMDGGGYGVGERPDGWWRLPGGGQPRPYRSQLDSPPYFPDESITMLVAIVVE